MAIENESNQMVILPKNQKLSDKSSVKSSKILMDKRIRVG